MWASTRRKGLTTDKRIRQAFNYAVDKKTITHKILFGVAKPLDAPFPNNIFGHSTMAEQYDYNPEKAKALLKEANFPKDAVIKMITPNGRYTYDKTGRGSRSGLSGGCRGQSRSAHL